MVGIISAWFNIAVCIGIPVAFVLILGRKWKGCYKLFLIGAGTFYVSQFCIRTPLLALLQNTEGYKAFSARHPVWIALFLAFTAGLAEETARYAGFRLLVKDNRPEAAPLCCGLGHGGIEAFMIGLNNVFLVLFSSEYLIQTGWLVSLAGIERISTMIAHVAFSFIVYRAARSRSIPVLILAILLHTIYDLSVVLLYFGVSDIMLEILLLAFSLVLLFFVLIFQKRSKS